MRRRKALLPRLAWLPFGCALFACGLPFVLLDKFFGPDYTGIPSIGLCAPREKASVRGFAKAVFK